MSDRCSASSCSECLGCSRSACSDHEQQFLPQQWEGPEEPDHGGRRGSQSHWIHCYNCHCHLYLFGQPGDCCHSVSQVIPSHLEQQVCVQPDPLQLSTLCAGAAFCRDQLHQARMDLWRCLVQFLSPALHVDQLSQHAHSGTHSYRPVSCSLVMNCNKLSVPLIEEPWLVHRVEKHCRGLHGVLPECHFYFSFSWNFDVEQEKVLSSILENADIHLEFFKAFDGIITHYLTNMK